MTMPALRRHQDRCRIESAQATVDKPASLSLDVVAGGGKSRCVAITASVLAGDKKAENETGFTPKPGMIDGVVWIAPRRSLLKQATESLLEGPTGSSPVPWLPAAETVHDFIKDASSALRTNKRLGFLGFTTSFQQLSARSTEPLQEAIAKWSESIGRKPRLLIAADEVHHAAGYADSDESGATGWGNALADFVDLCTGDDGSRPHRLMMTGTPYRGDLRPVYGMPYGKPEPAVRNIHHCMGEVVRLAKNRILYPRHTGLKQAAIIPIRPSLYDATVAGFDASIADLPSNMARRAVQYAGTWGEDSCNADLIKGIVTDALQDRANGPTPNGQVIVVMRSRIDAMRVYNWLKAERPFNVRPVLAVSDYEDEQENCFVEVSEKGVQAIQAFRDRENGTDVLVTVGMAHEGMDAKWATHLVYLGAIRQTGWLEQCFARVWRKGASDLGKPFCRLFTFADLEMREYLASLKARRNRDVRLLFAKNLTNVLRYHEDAFGENSVEFDPSGLLEGSGLDADEREAVLERYYDDPQVTEADPGTTCDDGLAMPDSRLTVDATLIGDCTPANLREV